MEFLEYIFFHSNIIYFMSLLHIVVVISMDKLISFECDNNNRKIPFKKNRRLSTHIVRSYSSSQFEKSSTNSNSNYSNISKINLLTITLEATQKNWMIFMEY